MKDEIKLAIEGKDRDYFLSKGISFPKYWYGHSDLPKSKKKNRAYSTEMRALSEMSLDQLEVVEMFWGIAPLVVDKVKKLDVEFVENIPVPTATRVNALVQTKLSMISSDERKEWADRVEGKAVSREVSMALVTDDSDNTASATRELILDKFDELGNIWSEYGKDSKEEQKELEHDEVLRLEEGTDGETEG